MNRKTVRKGTRGVGILAVLLCATFLATNHARARDSRTGGSATAKIADLAWIAGNWETHLKGSHLQENWSEPIGDCMMGAFRWIREGKVWIYELLTIREEDGTLVLRFRHFSDELVPWEEKNEPLTYRLVSSTDREAIFENPDSESHRRYAFERLDDKTMIVSVGAMKNGKLSVDEFRYQKQ